MTGPVRVQMPLVQFDEPTFNPHTGGLFTAATVETSDAFDRAQGGIETTALNSGGHGYWDTGCGPQDDPDQVKQGVRPGRYSSDSMIVWAADDCGLIGNSVEESKARAQQILRLYEEMDAEAATVPVLLDKAGTPATAPTGADAFVLAVGAIEQALGKTGVAGVIHARRGLAALAARSGLVVSNSAGKLTTPLGNTWAFGAGYDELDNTLVGTGPVLVRKGPVFVQEAVAHRKNERTAIAERLINVTWALTTVAQNIG